MNSAERPQHSRRVFWLIAVLVSACTAMSLLIGGGPSAEGGKASKAPRLGISAVIKPKNGSGVSAILRGTQLGPKTRRGVRRMEVNAIAVGLEAGPVYGFGFDGKGQDIPTEEITFFLRFRASPNGSAVAEGRFRLTRKVFRQARTIALLQGDPDRPIIVGRGRLDRDFRAGRNDW